MSILTSWVLLFILILNADAFIQPCIDNPTKQIIQCPPNTPIFTLTSSATLSNCEFKFCSVIVIPLGMTLNLNNVEFTNSTRPNKLVDLRRGGAIQVLGGLQADNSKFINCSSWEGGAIGGEVDSTITITNSHFHNNTAGTREFIAKKESTGTRGGSISTLGVLELSNVSFEEGMASHGGDIYVFGVKSSLNWTGGYSSNQRAYGAEYAVLRDGGSIFADSLQTAVELQHITFLKKSVWNGGGAVVVQRCDLNVFNITARFCTARYGGAISALSQSTVTVDSSNFEKLDASYYGGAFQLWEKTILKLSNSRVSRCTVGGFGGGAGFFGNSVGIMMDTVFENNLAFDGDGGGIYAQHGYLDLTNVTLQDNVAASIGGGLMKLGPGYLKNCKFLRNKSDGWGGGIYSENLLEATDLEVALNSASGIGGGIYIWAYSAASYEHRSSRFYGSINITDNVSYGTGGGMFVSGAAVLEFYSPYFAMSGNAAANGGSGMYVNIYQIGDVKGGITRNYSNTETSFNIADQVFVSTLKTGTELAATGIFEELGIFAESKVYRVELVNTVGEMDVFGAVAPIEVAPIDVFGHHITAADTENPISIQVTIKNAGIDDQIGGSAVKSVFDNVTGTILFDDLSITSPKEFVDLEIKPMILLPESLEIPHLMLNVEVNICSPDENALLPIRVRADGTTQFECLRKMKVSTDMRVSFAIAALCLIAVSIAMAVFAEINKKVNIFRLAGAKFTQLIAFGCILQFASIAVGVFVNDAGCLAMEWLEFTGFTLVGIVIIVKTYRVKLIFSGKEIRNGSLKDEYLLKVIALFVLVANIFMVLWTIFDYPRISDVLLESHLKWVQIDMCRGSLNIFPAINVSLHIALFLAASLLAFLVRNIPSTFNESRELGIISYQYIILHSLFYPIGEVIVVNESFSYLIRVVRIMLPAIATMGFLLGTRVYVFITDPEKAKRRLNQMTLSLDSEHNKRVACNRKSVRQRRNYTSSYESSIVSGSQRSFGFGSSNNRSHGKASRSAQSGGETGSRSTKRLGESSRDTNASNNGKGYSHVSGSSSNL